MHPEQFDVILCTIAVDDILSDVAAGLAGRVGVAPPAAMSSPERVVAELGG